MGNKRRRICGHDDCNGAMVRQLYQQAEHRDDKEGSSGDSITRRPPHTPSSNLHEESMRRNRVRSMITAAASNANCGGAQGAAPRPRVTATHRGKSLEGPCTYHGGHARCRRFITSIVDSW
jgi:hypothetical protein